MILTHGKLCELGFPFSVYGCCGLYLNWTYDKQEAQLPLSWTAAFENFLNCRDHKQRHLSHLKILNPIAVVMDNGI